MITLTFAGANGTITAQPQGTSGYVVLSFAPNVVARDNTYAQSRWVDGAYLTSSRTDLLALSTTIRVHGTTVADMINKVAALGSAVDAFGYTVTAAYNGGGSTVYTAMPASYAVEYDPNSLRNLQVPVALTIPVQP
jgi:hypothetical protein